MDILDAIIECPRWRRRPPGRGAGRPRRSGDGDRADGAGAGARLGFQRNAQTPDGLSGLVAALATGNHRQTSTMPSGAALAGPGALLEGNGILGHVLGSKDASRALADRTASQTGISPEVLKRLLPIAASLMMAAFARQQAQGGLPARPRMPERAPAACSAC